MISQCIHLTHLLWSRAGLPANGESRKGLLLYHKDLENCLTCSYLRQCPHHTSKLLSLSSRITEFYKFVFFSSSLIYPFIAFTALTCSQFQTVLLPIQFIFIFHFPGDRIIFIHVQQTSFADLEEPQLFSKSSSSLKKLPVPSAMHSAAIQLQLRLESRVIFFLQLLSRSVMGSSVIKIQNASDHFCFY